MEKTSKVSSESLKMENKSIIDSISVEKMIKARNILSEVFNENKLAWCEEEWMSKLCHSIGDLDLAIKGIIKIKK
jgi:hypothetical protein